MARHETGDGERDRRPFAELTPEEQRERRRAAARKAAETRARRKAEREAAEAAAVDHALAESTADDAATAAGAEAEIAAGVAASEAPVADTPTELAAPADASEPPSASEPIAAPAPSDSPTPDVRIPSAPEQTAATGSPTTGSTSALGREESVPLTVDTEVTTADERRSHAEDDDIENADAVVSAAGIATDAELRTDNADEVVLRLANVTRRFGATVAIEDVSFEVRAGECHGVVGVNGAGKSTTLAIAAGLVRASVGSVEVLGHGIGTREAQRQLGVVPDRMRLFDRLTGRQLLVHTAMLHRVARADAITRADALLERLGLTPDADRLVADYSIGMQQLVAVAAALIHAPSVVVLDEPFETIDPVATDSILTVLAELRARGGAVLLTSHDMTLVERACDHVVVLHDGAVRASGPLDVVRDGLSLERRFARLVGASPSEELPWLSPSRG